MENSKQTMSLISRSVYEKKMSVIKQFYSQGLGPVSSFMEKTLSEAPF